MNWNVIGQSVIGTSHAGGGKGCEDHCAYQVIPTPSGEHALVFFASDGAGSAAFAAAASETAVLTAMACAEGLVRSGQPLTEAGLYEIAEAGYDRLAAMAAEAGVPKNEYSCTLLGGLIMPEQAGFLQIGDGAIVYDDGTGHFHTMWWPHNGEYQNATAFLIDDPSLTHLQKKIVDTTITEFAAFTDGLQQLALNYGTQTVHQPFLQNLFPSLRKASAAEHLSILNQRLIDYLGGEAINARTDDDKTLILATSKL